jgi:hypothetical protein
MAATSGGERRERMRATVRGAASVVCSDGATICQVRDLSATGVRLVGTPAVDVRRPLRFEMRVMGVARVAVGQVAWQQINRHGENSLGVDLSHGRRRLRADLAELVVRAQNRAGRGLALLVDHDQASAALLAEYLWNHGYEVIDETTPLGAIERLESGQIDLVAIGSDLTTCTGGEFAGFVAENFPRVHRLLVAQSARGTGAHGVMAGDLFADLPRSRATHAVVRLGPTTGRGDGKRS